MIPVNEPLIAPNALSYVSDCIKTGWVSSSGPYIDKFEKAFANYLGVSFATTTTNGTTALQLALASLGIDKGDEVIVPDLTIISCALAPLYLNAVPVAVDVDPKTGTIDPTKIEGHITKRTKAIMVVHLYGHPCDMDPIMDIARRHNIPVIEDAAEAHGAEYKGKKVGSIADIGCFSFYGNKIITTGEGGMMVTNTEALYTRAKILKDLAHSPNERFYHEEVGYNFRMTNMQAGLGLAQLEQIDLYLQKKHHMASLYSKNFHGFSALELPTQAPWAKNVYWMYAVRVSKSSPINRDEVRIKLKEKGIDTRDFFVPLHLQPVCTNRNLFKHAHCPVSTDLSERGLYLPSGLAITDKQINTVSKAVIELLS